MSDKKEPKIPEPFKPHPNLDNKINRGIIESELEGGVYLKDVSVGHFLEVETQNRIYIIERRPDGFYISGHPEHCPEPVKVRINGSTWGGSMIKTEFIGRGMRLEYFHQGLNDVVTTSKIKEIKEFKGLAK